MKTIEERAREYADLRLDPSDDDKLATEVYANHTTIYPPEGYLIGKVTDVEGGMIVEFVKKK